MGRWGLVLGGGGPVGAAWFAGLAQGLALQGILLGGADVVIGTSAGAWAGAWLASRQAPESFIDALRSRRDIAIRETAHRASVSDPALMTEVYSILGAASTPLAPDACRQIGKLARRVPPRENDAQSYPKAYAPYVPIRWPKTFRAVTVNVDTGEVRLIGIDDGISLAAAVAASCAAPGIVSPVPLNDGHYMDGGARSPTSADLVAGFGVELCLVASPVPPDAPMIGGATVRILDAETSRLSDSGIAVVGLRPTGIEMKAFGFDLLNLTKVEAAIEAGRQRAAVEADRIRSAVDRCT